MKHALIVLALAALPGLAPCAAAAQDPQAEEVLTNGDIVTLTEAGLPTPLILAKIAATPTAFDTSVEALVALSEAAVDPDVLAAMIPTPDALSRQSIDFGDDTSRWAGDGECDDPRFRGAGMSLALRETDRGHDATDCRELFDSGRITLKLGSASLTDVTEPIDFGDDTSDWARDGECDDPRFEGVGMAFSLSDEHRGRDATDCRRLFDSGSIRLRDADSVGAAVRE